MSRKNYSAIADILKSQPDDTRKEDLIARLADYFKEDNPNFNAKAFAEACKENGR